MEEIKAVRTVAWSVAQTCMGPSAYPGYSLALEVPSATLQSLPSASPSALILIHTSKGENRLSPLSKSSESHRICPWIGEDLEPKKANH